MLVDRFVFFPDRSEVLSPADYGLDFEDVWIPTDDGFRLHSWWLAGSSDDPVVLFFHGNAGNIGHRLERARLLVERGLGILLLDYRGYGRSEGSPSEKGLYRDTRAAFDVLTRERGVPPDRIVLFGESIGGAVAIELATRVRPRALIVESTFTSIRDMAPLVLPFVPRFVVPNAFDSTARVACVGVPILVVHGTRDSIVPFEQGRRLFERAREPKRFHEIAGGDHNDLYLVGGEAYADRIAEFCRQPER